MTEPLTDAHQDTWWLESDPQPASTETEAQREERQSAASDALDHAIHSIAQGVHDLTTHLANAAEAMTDALAYPELAATIAWLQERKRELGEAEAYLARELGRLEGCPDSITLADGRRAEVMKGKARKEWRHADWQRDVRAAVVREAGLSETNVVDAQTGEEVDVQALLAAAQAVHGSAAPKTTALKPLGLAADDYCSSFPGPYSVRVSAPETTDQEG